MHTRQSVNNPSSRPTAASQPPEAALATPRESGYRAVHLVLQYDGRSIEIQLRTRLMHEWAVAVERFGGRINQDLKSGEGPAEVLDWLEAVAEALAIEDQGGIVDTMLMDRIGELRQVAAPYLLPGGPR